MIYLSGGGQAANSLVFDYNKPYSKIKITSNFTNNNAGLSAAKERALNLRFYSVQHQPGWNDSYH